MQPVFVKPVHPGQRREFEFVGVMLGDGVDQDKVGADLDALCSVLVNTGRRGVWRSL